MPSHPVQGADRLGTQQGWGYGGKDQDPPRPKERRVLGRTPFLPTLRPDAASGLVGLLLRQAIGVDIAVDSLGARGRPDPNVKRTERGPRLCTQLLHEIQALAVAIVHRQMGRTHPEDDLGLFPDRLDNWGRIGIPTIGQRDVPRPQGKVLQAFTGMLIRDRYGDKL